MSLEKLSKQLRRDIAANPKKAAALGLMVVVALYFWGPLVWKFLPAAGAKRDSKANMASLIITDDPAEPGQQNQARRGPKFRWEKVRQLISQDSRMASATYDVGWIDPFAKPATSGATLPAEASTEGQAATAAAAAAAGTDPKSLGLVLGGIMIGPRGRVATINGDSHRTGDVITFSDKQNSSISHQFRVFRINRTSVQLERNGQVFTLEHTPPKLAHGDDLERTKPTK